MNVGLLSTYPPTQCGLAAFSSSLRESLLADQPGTTTVFWPAVASQYRQLFDSLVS